MTSSNGSCGEIGKRGALVEKGKGPWQRNIFIKTIGNVTLSIQTSRDDFEYANIIIIIVTRILSLL